MSTPNAITRSGMMTTPPPRPVSAPSSPAATEPVATSAVSPKTVIESSAEETSQLLADRFGGFLLGALLLFVGRVQHRASSHVGRVDAHSGRFDRAGDRSWQRDSSVILSVADQVPAGLLRQRIRELDAAFQIHR